MTDKRKVVVAVNFLVQANNCTRLMNEITGIVDRWATRPMIYSGRLEPLNALIDVGVANKEALKRLFALVEKKRKLIPMVKRANYQRDLMAQRRLRQHNALELYELTHGRLNPVKRKEYVTKLQKDWMGERDKFVAKKGKLDWKQRNAAAAEFWAEIDRRLLMNLQVARRKSRNR